MFLSIPSRYDSERQLFAGVDESEGFDPDNPNASWNLERDTRSYFTELLDNDDLLERFVDDTDKILDNDRRQKIRSSNVHHKNKEEQEFDPESAYMRINAKLRNAIKKHTPWVGNKYGCNFF